MVKKAHPLDESCPCGSGAPLADCCEPLLAGAVSAATAEALMRSRYTAYALGREAYLLASWHPSTRPASLQLEQAPQPRWIGLEVKRHVVLDDAHAIVEFVARCRIGGRASRMREVSRFVREAGRWYYVGEDPAA